MKKTEKEITRRANAGGFTLVELLLVVTILGVLAAVAVVGLVGFGDDARVNGTRTSIAAIEQAARIWEIRTGNFPDSIDQMIKEGLLDDKALNDSFGHPFQYKRNGDKIEIRSAGKSGNFGTDDDITN